MTVISLTLISHRSGVFIPSPWIRVTLRPPHPVDCGRICSKVTKVHSSSVMIAETLILAVLRQLVRSLTILKSPWSEEDQVTWRCHLVGVRSQLWPTWIIPIQMPDKGVKKSPDYSSIQSFESFQLRPQKLWKQDKPSLWIPDLQNSEHNKMLVVLDH